MLRDTAMVILALISVFLIIFEVLSTLGFSAYHSIGWIDLVISGLFLGDFFLHLHNSPDKRRFWRRHWWELLAAIPFVLPISPTILRFLRIARFIIRLKILIEASTEYAKNSYAIYIVNIVLIIIFSGAAGFHYFEFGTNPNVHSYWDSIWWAIVTSTTIGYGDIFPVTTGGRVVAIGVMFFGIASLGTFIASINSYFLNRRLKRLKKR